MLNCCSVYVLYLRNTTRWEEQQNIFVPKGWVESAERIEIYYTRRFLEAYFNWIFIKKLSEWDHTIDEYSIRCRISNKIIHTSTLHGVFCIVMMTAVIDTIGTCSKRNTLGCWWTLIFILKFFSEGIKRQSNSTVVFRFIYIFTTGRVRSRLKDWNNPIPLKMRLCRHSTISSTNQCEHENNIFTFDFLFTVLWFDNHPTCSWWGSL